MADFGVKFAFEGAPVLMGKNCKYFRKITLILGSLFFSLSVQAQVEFPPPKAFITPDTDLIGSPVQYTLFVQHPAKSIVLFPDSGFRFDPFEFRSKIAFPSRIGSDSILTDCCRYELASFDVNPALRLALPVYYITLGGDSLPVLSNEAVLFQKFVTHNSITGADSLLSSTQPLPVAEQVNYPIIGFGIVLVLAIVLLANVFLGRPIERWFRLAVLGRRHQFFIRSFDRLVDQIAATQEPSLIERALNLWKTYIERLEEVPYSTYTTSDFARTMTDKNLMNSLHTIDRWVYGGFKPEGVEGVFGVLKRSSIRMYSRKREEVRNG